MFRLRHFIFLFALAAFAPEGRSAEIFGKGAASRTFAAANRWTLSYTAAGGLAFELIPRVRIEGRYTNRTTLQNALDIVVDTNNVTLSDVQTKTDIYSLGVDIDILGRRSSFRPFIYLGAGYLIAEQTYRIGAISGTPIKREQLTLTLGAGFRLALAKSIAFEIEVFAYPQDFDNLTNQLNVYANIGLRLFL